VVAQGGYISLKEFGARQTRRGAVLPLGEKACPPSHVHSAFARWPCVRAQRLEPLANQETVGAGYPGRARQGPIQARFRGDGQGRTARAPGGRDQGDPRRPKTGVSGGSFPAGGLERTRSPRNGISKTPQILGQRYQQSVNSHINNAARRQRWSGLTDSTSGAWRVRLAFLMLTSDVHEEPPSAKSLAITHSCGGNGLNGSYRISSDDGVGLTLRIA
jgi:hypothetical protein